MSESTGVFVNDGEWHFIAVVWRSAGGELVVFNDGVKALPEVLIGLALNCLQREPSF